MILIHYWKRKSKKSKSESWSKLDKTMKIQKLHMFAEEYGRKSTLPVKEIKALKQFLQHV